MIINCYKVIEEPSRHGDSIQTVLKVVVGKEKRSSCTRRSRASGQSCLASGAMSQRDQICFHRVGNSDVVA